MFSILKKFFYSLKNSDLIITGIVFILINFSLVIIYGIESSSKQDLILFKKQIIFSIIGLILMFIFSQINYKSLNSYAKHLYIISVILLILVLLFGQTIRGTKGWFKIAGFGIQPVEFAKLSIIIWLAYFFSKQARNIDLFKNIFISGVWTGIIVFFVLIQPDFGSAITIFSIWFLLLLVIGIKRKHLLFLIILLIITGLIGWNFFLKPYQKDRILIFLNPSQDPLGRGYNITQAMIAVGGGKLFGRGLGYGSQSQLKFLPENKTDFIFAVIGEELGFIGISLLITLYAILFTRMIVIIQKCENDFGSFLVLGILILFFVQVMINIGMNIGIAPVTGISLPFISYGGSFLIISLIMIGIVQSVYKNR